VEAGKRDLVVKAIAEAERLTVGEIRVHLSRRWLERDPVARAERIFHAFKMERSPLRNSVLLYVNLKARKLAIIGDEGIHHMAGQPYWEKLVRELQEDLRETFPENAIASAVRRIGTEMARHFPVRKRPSSDG
jgi:uncharacterized membrane protein